MTWESKKLGTVRRSFQDGFVIYFVVYVEELKDDLHPNV